MAEEKIITDHKVELGVGNEAARTFVFYDEGHTLGNPLRTIIMQQPEVSFCGYSVPHPVEPKMNIRIQTMDGNATKVLDKSLDILSHICDVIEERYNDALNN